VRGRARAAGWRGRAPRHVRGGTGHLAPHRVESRQISGRVSLASAAREARRQLARARRGAPRWFESTPENAPRLPIQNQQSYGIYHYCVVNYTLYFTYAPQVRV
jgi:hypothetical protein